MLRVRDLSGCIAGLGCWNGERSFDPAQRRVSGVWYQAAHELRNPRMADGSVRCDAPPIAAASIERLSDFLIKLGAHGA